MKGLNKFLSTLKAKLKSKGATPAMLRDLAKPDELAETVSHSIGTATQRISLTPPKEQEK